MIAGCFSVRWSQVQNNEFRHCIALGGVSDDVSAFMIREGASYNIFNSCVSDACQSGIRFILNGEDADYCGHDNVFNNCIIKNSGSAIDLNPYYYNSAPVDDNLVVNCVFDNANYLFNCERPNTGNQLINCVVKDIDGFSVGDYSSHFEYLYCDFFNNGFSLPSGSGNIDTNPLFVDGANGDYHLESGSFCIDAGTTSNAPPTDFEGTIRPQGSGIDIGAYEYSGVTGITDEIETKIITCPNPTNDIVFLPQYNNAVYKMYSISGQLIKKGTLVKHIIDLHELAPGLYTLKVSDVELTKKQKGVIRIIKR